MASALALVPAPRAVRTVRAARARSARGGLVVVAGKKGAWAKEFDPEYEKEKTVATVDDAKWPGLDSACSRSEAAHHPRVSPKTALAPPPSLPSPARAAARVPSGPVSSTPSGARPRPLSSAHSVSPKCPPSPPPDALPPSAEDKEKDPATYNILVKKTGPLNVTWNGVGVLQVPKGRDNAESNNVAKTVLIQRKEQVMAEVARLYPKMKGDLDFVIQMFEDPYADPVDMSQVPPEGMEAVPAEIKYMPKGKRYPF